ncbi:hypothetical protein RF11_15914 [Thelohanellus kitauei]|uniref:Uncharacterized protein n=1 Tax=Thelohanellus kitauei TaxID=669202 RepID=A0A0C2IIC7_THEKT|nr:hypothetical protein RF11_15914 [Thelohanellus kitauei]
MPLAIIQVDECLLRGRRKFHCRMMLLGDEAIPDEDVLEFEILSQNADEEMDHRRHYGRRITGPLIFGLVECHLTEDGSYISNETRMFNVDRRNVETLLPIIQGAF